MFSTGTGAPGSVANFRGERDPHLFDDRRYAYNFAPANYLQLPLERLSAFGRASFELGPSADLFAQVLYADYSARHAARTGASQQSVRADHESLYFRMT
jgi:hypothetical protein